MDAMRGMDPSTSLFQTQAARNLSQIGFSSVRSQKEVAPKEEPQEQHEVRDNVQLSSAGPAADTPETQEMTDNAAMSGELGELLDDYDEDSDEIKERRERDNGYGIEGFDGQQRSSVEGVTKPEEVARLNEMDNAALAVNDILRDVPQSSLEPAKNIVANQLQNNRPAEALVTLKPVEGVNAVDFTPVENVGLLDIHDTNNKPMTEDPEADMDAQMKQDVTGSFMDNAINGLSDDRKAMVDEMRDAVNAWASSNGVDPQAAFAERLSDLAKGWDDENLQMAASTYVEAGRELATSAAG